MTTTFKMTLKMYVTYTKYKEIAMHALNGMVKRSTLTYKSQ